MQRSVLHLLLATAACCGLSWLMFRVGGPYGLVVALPIFGCLAWPIVNLLDELRMGAHRRAMMPLSGVFYSFQGTEVHVVEDDDYCQWVPADEVRKIVGQGAPDRLLALAYPDGWCVMGKPPKGYLRDDALMMYLAKETSLRGIKFKVWVERNIALQANKRRQRFGVRISDPRAPDLQPNHLRDTDVPRDMRSTLPQA